MTNQGKETKCFSESYVKIFQTLFGYSIVAADRFEDSVESTALHLDLFQAKFLQLWELSDLDRSIQTEPRKGDIFLLTLG